MGSLACARNDCMGALVAVSAEQAHIVAAIGDKLHAKHRYRVLARALSIYEELYAVCCVPSMREMMAYDSEVLGLGPVRVSRHV